MNEIVQPSALTAKDFETDQEVRWCPGCGDYAILKSVRQTLADLGATPHNTVFVSGIGCSSRFPYYMATYGFHTIHGRAPAIATGVKMANPELDVWIVTGDGDGMSIGGNHLFHILRRNVDVQLLLFNNEIYGLTKGQYSPTSRPGTRSPSSPGGSRDANAAPCVFALGAGARFVARSADTLQKHMPVVLKRAKEHAGASFVEILQNCIIYNDAVFDEVTNKKTGADHTIYLEHGQPMVFGKERNRGIMLNTRSLSLEVVPVGEGGRSEDELLVHDETNPTLAAMLARMGGPEFPTALGVLYCEPAAPYSLRDAEYAGSDADPRDAVKAMVHRGRVWTVE